MLPALFGMSFALSLLSFLLLGADKRRAQKGQRRIAEVTLHGIELLGGWPGSLVAQRVFHHKTRKVRYQVMFYLAAFVHVGLVFVLVAWRQGLMGRWLDGMPR